MIQTLENFFSQYVERHFSDWMQHLSLAKFTANNAVKYSNGLQSFLPQCWRAPHYPVYILGDTGDEPSSGYVGNGRLDEGRLGECEDKSDCNTNSYERECIQVKAVRDVLQRNRGPPIH